MSIYYELLDKESGTLLNEYETEAAALDDLRAFGLQHGQDQLQGLALLRVSDEQPKLVAMDQELIARVSQSERVTLQPISVSGATALRVESKLLPSRKLAMAACYTGSTATARWILVCA
jgi:hypothetical protein